MPTRPNESERQCSLETGIPYAWIFLDLDVDLNPLQSGET